MGNRFVRLSQPLKSVFHMTCKRSEKRRECYDAEAKDEVRHSNFASGFKFEETHRHPILSHTRTFRKGCFSCTSPTENNELECDIKACTTDQDFVDTLMASDDQCKIVAAIGNIKNKTTNQTIFCCKFFTLAPLFSAAVISSFASEASLDMIKVTSNSILQTFLELYSIIDRELRRTAAMWMTFKFFISFKIGFAKGSFIRLDKIPTQHLCELQPIVWFAPLFSQLIR